MYRYSGITIEKLLTMDILLGAKVLAGKGGFSRRITKVNVMEVPDIIEWVSQGEFLITTAYSIKDNISMLSELIPKLKAKGVAGIGIKVGRYVNELPQTIINVADEINFPIIEVPFSVSHTDIISGILTEVINDQMNMLVKIEDFNNEVMNIMIKGGKLDQIGQKLYDNIQNSLAIYENIYNSYEIFCDDKDRSEIEALVKRYINERYVSEKRNIRSEEEEVNDIIDNTGVSRSIMPIVIENIEYGSILIWRDKRQLTPLDNMLIESYLHVIALEFVKKLSLYNMESNYRMEFFDDLLSDNANLQKKAIERSKNFNFNKELKYSVIVIRITEEYLSTKSVNKGINLYQEQINRIVYTIGRLAKHRSVIFVEKSDRVIMLFGCDKGEDNATTKGGTITFCSKLNEEICKNKNFRLAIGIGRAYENYSQLYKSYGQAKLIVEKLNNKTGGGVTHYDDLGLYKILSYDGFQGELLEFCTDTIKPLIDYDKTNNAELIKTLGTYFECDGNMKKISEKMYVHYNTIIYRLQKIRDIIGLDLENGDNRLNLQIALKAMDLLEI